MTLTAVIPLEQGLIQFKVSGSLQKENQMRAILETMLNSLQAATGLLARIGGYGYLLVALGILFVFR